MPNDQPIFVPEGISQRTIAARAGVSVATVSRAVSGSPHVTPRTRTHIQQVVNELIGDNARSRRSIPGQRVIGLTSSHLVEKGSDGVHTMMQEILGGVEAVGLSAGVSVYTIHRSAYLVKHDGLDMLNRLDGLLLAGGVVSPEIIRTVLQRRIPTVVVGGHIPDSSLSSVSGDVARGTYLLVRHLAELGHRDIAFVNGPSETYTSFERRAGYLEGLYDAGLSMDRARIRWVDGYDGFFDAAGYHLARGVLAEPEPPTAIIFAADSQAVGGLRAIQESGRRVPEDISIVGFDNTPLSRATSPRLTTVAVDRVEWGARAFDRLLRLIDGQRSFAGDRLLLPVTLEIRESTGPAPAR